jgi:hypothetical protein
MATIQKINCRNNIDQVEYTDKVIAILILYFIFLICCCIYICTLNIYSVAIN